MESVKPDMLFMELCSSRTGILEDTSDELEQIIQEQHKDTSRKGKKPGIGYMVKEIIERNPDMSRSAALSTVLLNNIQGDYASKLGVTIGGEFKEAFKMGQRQQREYERWQNDLRWEQTFGASSRGQMATASQTETNLKPCVIILGDRPVRLTLLRAWESLSMIGKIKLIFGLLISSLRKPSADELKQWMESIMNDPNNDLLTKSIEELSRHFPTIKTTIIEERDTFMTAKLLQLTNMAGAYYVGQKKDKIYTIVAIVGAGHCPGILQKLEEVKHDFNKLESLESLLEGVVETKKYKLENEEMQAVVTDVVSMDLSQT
jgi:pheromone shutdown protein TraB